MSIVVSRAGFAVVLAVAQLTPSVADPAIDPAAPSTEAVQSAPSTTAARDETSPALLAPTEVKLPALSFIELRVIDEVTSKTAIAGQQVRLELARPVYLTPGLGIPEGTPVEGVVIHAAKGGMGGKSGELLLGAKKLRLGDQLEVPLRSFKLGPARGKNNETLAFATAVAVGLPALLINGGSAKIPAGMAANAKTSVDVSIPVTLLSQLPPIQAAIVSPPTQSVQATPTQPTSTQGESK